MLKAPIDTEWAVDVRTGLWKGFWVEAQGRFCIISAIPRALWTDFRTGPCRWDEGESSS